MTTRRAATRQTTMRQTTVRQTTVRQTATRAPKQTDGHADGQTRAAAKGPAAGAPPKIPRTPKTPRTIKTPKTTKAIPATATTAAPKAVPGPMPNRARHAKRQHADHRNVDHRNADHREAGHREPPAAARPPSLRSVVRTYAAGHVTPRHEHDWPQLLYASSGVMAVETANGSWIVPPQRAIWLPSRSWHITRMLTEVKLASLYLRRTRGSPARCEILDIGSLMRELLVAAIDVDFSGPLTRRETSLATLIGEELAIAPRGGSPIPMPGDRRLLPFCQRVLKDPSLQGSLEAHAAAMALTPKTVSRLFQRELGMTFRDWRQLVQSAYALAHLIQGEPVKVVASRLGYTASAFSVMMRRNLRLAPAALRHAYRNAYRSAAQADDLASETS